ncbi:MAG: hypothetical protein K2W96_22265, partial [Gemmataceae bacterium]|nr:hypothetical protein [Gemmataceae bacterium]
MLLYVVLSVAAIGLLVGLYFAFGPGPVRARASARGRKALDAGDWQQALAVAERHLSSSLPASWSARFHALAGDAHQWALDDAIKAREFE